MTDLETARQEALTQVRAAKREAAAARGTGGLTAGQRHALEELYLDLDDQEDQLTKAALDQRIEALRLASGKLTEVARTIGEEIGKLEKVAQVVDRAAKAIKIVADVAGQVGTVALL